MGLAVSLEDSGAASGRWSVKPAIACEAQKRPGNSSSVRLPDLRILVDISAHVQTSANLGVLLQSFRFGLGLLLR